MPPTPFDHLLDGEDAAETFASFDPQTQALAANLAQVLSRTSVESRWNLLTALGSAKMSGVGGTVTVRIPRKSSEHVLINWLGGVLGLQFNGN